MSDFEADWADWHQRRERALRRPDGWLAITAIHWLTPDPQRYDDVPGEWSGRPHGALLVLGEDEVVSLDGRRLEAGAHELGPLDVDGVTLSFGDAVAQVADRDGATIVRPRHPDAPNLRAYVETPCYPPDPRWVVAGRFEPYAGTSSADPDALVGDVVFEHAGAEHRLAAWPQDDGALWVLLRDGTSGTTTYEASRQQVVAAPGPDGDVVVDLNRTYNLPCAYTDFATCPVPPRGNTLPFPLEAGEQLPTFTR